MTRGSRNSFSPIWIIKEKTWLMTHMTCDQWANRVSTSRFPLVRRSGFHMFSHGDLPTRSSWTVSSTLAMAEMKQMLPQPPSWCQLEILRLSLKAAELMSAWDYSSGQTGQTYNIFETTCSGIFRPYAPLRSITHLGELLSKVGWVVGSMLLPGTARATATFWSPACNVSSFQGYAANRALLWRYHAARVAASGSQIQWIRVRPGGVLDKHMLALMTCFRISKLQTPLIEASWPE